MMIETDTKAQPAGVKYPKGACYFAYKANALQAGVLNLDTREQCLAWLQKLHELDATEEEREIVQERLRGLK